MKVDPRMKDTEYVVEADSFAMQALWAQFSTQSMYKTPMNTYRWEQDSMGYCVQIGEFGDMPVCITFFWYKINGHLIAFVDAHSQVVDHRMVDDYLKKYCNPMHNGSRAHADANNFAHVLGYIRDSEAQRLLDWAKKAKDKALASDYLQSCWTHYPWACDKEVMAEAKKISKAFAEKLTKLRPSNGAER